jgi:hypothetical protein
MHASAELERLFAVDVPSAQVRQLVRLSAGPPADHVPVPHSSHEGPPKPGRQPARCSEVTAEQQIGCHDSNTTIAQG